ncbi:TPA: DUF1542 domain-containing protein [Streptococcus suis]|nr:DUF1542 domain-containing protein [Streptococcus suis]HEM5248208.1 DUF1542 domain-containing protein [Streptococcus suis]HEO8634236.1 DUF1542 domain-containing protein [Streptococcus suis]
MSSKDMFRKEQRFSFRKFSFGLASAVIANVIFGGAIANSPVVHANTATETAAVATSERIASIPYTVNIVDQAGKVVETKEKKVLVYTVETIATATEYLTADLVPEGYAIVSGLGEVTLTEKADNIFTVKVDKIAPEAAAPTTTAESATSETATPEPASLAATQSTPVTSEVAEAEVAPTTSEESAKPTERTVYLSYITHYVNEANETVDRTGHLVAVKTTDETAKTQVTVSASENMPSGWELVQDKAKVVVQLVENQTNILVFAVTKKSKEEEIAESQLSNRDVLMRLSLEADLLADEALRQVAKEQAGNTALETAANETKAVAATANEVLANDAATETELDDQIDTVRTSTQNLAAEMLKVDADGILTAMLDATTQAITITTSEKGRVRPNYADHIRDFATNNSQQSYNDQDFFFGLIGKELTQDNSQIRATAQASDASTPTISILGGGGEPINGIQNFGLRDNGSGVLYGTTTISDAGNAFSWQFKASSGSNTAASKFTFVPYTVVKTDEEPVRKAVSAGVTADEILAKVKSDVTRGNDTSSTTEATAGPLNIAFEQHFNENLTARATGTSTTVAADAKTGKQIWHEIKEYVKVAEADGTAVSGTAVTGSLPTEAGTYNVTVLSTNVHGQTIENTVKVVLNAAPTITASGTGLTNPFNTTNPERKIVYIFGITTGDTEAVTTAKAETGEKAKAPIFDRDIAQPVATITDADSTSIKVEYGDNAPLSRFNNLGSNMVATAADGTVLRDTKGNSTNVTITDGTAKIYLGGTYEYLPGGKFTRQFIISDESNAVVRGEAFYTVSYTDKLKDDTPIAKNQDVALTKEEVVAKLTLDTQAGRFNDTNPNLTVPESEVTRTIVGYRTVTVGEDGSKVKGELVKQEDLTQFPKDKDLEVKVKTTNIYGQTVYNWVSVDYNLKPKVEIVDAVEGTTKTVYVFSKNNDRTENSEGVTGTNVAFDRNKATKSVVNITDDGQVTRVVYNDGKYDTADMLDKGVTPTTLVGTDGYFTGSVAVPAGTNTTRLLKVTDDKGLVGQSPTFRVYAFSDTVPANVTPVRLAKGTSPALEEITAKMVIDSNSGYPRNPKVEIPKDAYTRTVVGYRLDGSQDTVAVDSVEKLPTEGSYKVRVKTSNAYGQEIYNWVPVSHYKLEEVSRDIVTKYTDFESPIHAIIELGSSGTVGTVKLEGDRPADFNIANFNLKADEAAKLAERNLEFVKADSLGTDGTVGTIRPKDGGKVEYTGSGNLDYVFEYTYQVNNENKTSNLTYTILYTDTQKPIMTPKSEYIRFVDEEYKISVPGTDNAFLSTEKINGSLSVLKDGESGKVSPGLGTNTAIASELDPKGVDVSGGVDNQGGNSTMFNVNITGTAPSAEGTGTYNLRVGENNYPAGPNVERVDGKVPENVGLTPVTVTFVKRAAMTTPVAVVDPANLTADEKAAVIAQLKKDNADNEKLNALPDTAFTVNADGTVSVDYSAGNADVDAVTDKVANATVKLADEQKKAKDAIDTKLAEEKAAIEAKRDEAIAEINNTPGLTDDQKKAATDAVTNTANDALTALDTAADDAKKAIDTKTTVAGINDAKTTGEKALDDATATGEAAIELTKDKELAKADVDNQAKDAIEAIKNNPNLDATEQAPYIEAIEKAAEEQKAAIDKAKDTAGITDAVNAAEKVNEEQKLAAAKEDAKDKIAEEAAAAKEAIDDNPNLSEDEKKGFKDAVDAEAAKAVADIEKATTPEAAQAAEEAGTKAIAEDVLDAAKQDAKNKIAKDLATVEAAIDANSNLSEDEKKAAKLEAQAKAAEAVANIEKATTPEAAQTLEDAAVKDLANIEIKAAYDDAVKAIEAADNLSTAAKTKALDDLKKARQAAEDAVKNATTADEVAKGALDGLKSIAKIEATAAADDAKEAIAKNSNLTADEKKVYTDAIDKALKDTETKIDAATDADTVDAETVLAQKDIAKQEVAAATADAVKGIEANTNLTDAEKDEYKATVTKAAETAEKAIADATTAADIQSKTFDATQDVAKEEVKADAADAIAGIKANDNLSDTAKEEAIAAIEEARDTTLENIENAKTAADVDTATLDAEKANAKAEIKAAADDAKKAIDENANLPESDKNALKLAIDAEVAATNLEIDNAKTAEEIDAATLATEKSIAKAEVKAAAEDALQAIDENANLTDDEKAKAKADVYVELSKAEKAIDKATTADAIDNATLVGEKAFAKEELEAAADDAKKAIDANTHLTDDQKQAAKDAVDAELAKAKEAVVAAKTADEVDAATLVGEKAVAKEEIKAAADDAKKAIDANSNLTDDEKAAAKAAVDTEVAKANEAIDKAATADAVDTATLVGEKAVAKEELKAAADDAKKAIDENANLTPEEKAAAKKAVDDEVAKAEKAIDAATKADEVETATLAGEKAVAKEEVKAAAEDAKKAIDENANLPESEKTALKLAIDAEVAATNLEIDNAKTAEEIDAATLVGEKAVAKEELKVAADDAKKAIDDNANLTPDEKQAAKDAVDAELAKANDAIDAAKTADEVDAATLVGEKAVAKEELKAAADDAKKAIDANDNLTADEKAAAKKAVDAEVAKANEAIDAAKTADAVDTATLVGEKAVAKEELKAAADDAKKAIDANDNLTADEKAAAKKAVDAEVAKANDAIDAAKTADAVDTATLVGEKAVAKEELKAAADDAKKAIDANDNLTADEKAAAKKAVDDEVAKANEAINAAKTADAVDTATLVGEKAVAKEELKAAADDAKKAIDDNANLTPEEKQAAKDAVDAEVAKANEAIDAAKTADAVDAATLVGEKAVAREELKAAANDAKAAIDANTHLTDDEKQAAKDAVDAELAKANDAIDAATTADEVETATLAGEKAVAKEELKAAADDAKKAIDENTNLTPEEKQAAKDAVDAEVAKANDAIDAATTADAVDTATLVGEKAVAKEELKAAADDAKKAIDANDNLTPAEKQAAKDAVDAEVAKANDAIDAAKTADAVDTATLVGEKAVAKEELKAAADDAKKAIDENANLTPEEKQAAKDAIDAEVAKANDAIDAAKTADEVDAATLVGEKAVAKEELKAAADDAKKAIEENTHLTDAEKQAAKDAVDAELAKANDAIDAATKADEVDVATLAGEKAVAKEALKAAAEDAKKAIDAAKQGAKNKLMEEADKAKAAIDANPNLTPEEKAAAKAEIDKAVEEAIISINGAGTHHALGEIKLPLSALIKPVVTVTPVLDPNNLTEEEIARIKALLEENNTFPEGTEIIVSKDASVSIKYPDGTIDLVLPAEIVKQADTTAPAITDDAKGNIVVAPTKEAVEFVVTYVDNNGKAQLVIVTKGADGKWTTTAKAVIVDPVTGQVIIPGSAIKPGTVVTAYSKDMAGNVSDLNSAEVEAVDANNPAAGVKVKSVTSTSNANKSTKKAKQLPNTGEKATSATSLGLAVLGMGLALFAAKRKKDEEEA